MNWSSFQKNVIRWGEIRGFDKSSPKTQYLSTIEEFNEILEAKSHLDDVMLCDAIGDVAVTLVILRMQIVRQQGNLKYPMDRPIWYVGDVMELSWRITRISNYLRREHWAHALKSIDEGLHALGLFSKVEGLQFEECCEAAWNEIKDRKGSMIDGSYVKYQDLSPEQRIDFVNREAEFGKIEQQDPEGPLHEIFDDKPSFCIKHDVHFITSKGCHKCKDEPLLEHQRRLGS